jgi:hypothetical protein
MKGFVSVVGILLLVLGAGMSATAVSICSYVSPETSLQSLGLSLSYRYFDDWSTAGVDTSGGRAALDYNRLYDSPDFGYTLDGDAEVLLKNLLPTSWAGSAAGTIRYYFMPDVPAFGFGGIEAWTATGQPQPAVHISAGLGYGRFSDVTPMAKALKIEQQLHKADAIGAPLGDEALLAIAETIGGTFASAKDQTAEVVNKIQAAAGTTLPPRQVLGVEDLVLETGDSRYCGWAVDAGIGYQLLDPNGQPTSFLVTASADAAFVPAPEGQMLFHAGFSGPLNILSENSLTIRASYDTVLCETSSLEASYTLLRVQPLGLPAYASHNASLLVSFTLGRADLGLQASLAKAANAAAWTLDISVSAAISFSD